MNTLLQSYTLNSSRYAYIAISERKKTSRRHLSVTSGHSQLAAEQTYWWSIGAKETASAMIEVQTSDSGNGDISPIINNNNADYMSIISAHVQALSDSLRHLSLTIHDNPEVRNKEFIAHEALTKFISEQDAKGQKWEVTPSAYGIGTAFVAVFDSGREGAVVSFNAEYGELICWSRRGWMAMGDKWS